MDLRSSRSRSKTPFLRSSIERELYDNGNNHVGQTVVRTTRSTTIKTTRSGADNFTDIDSVESHSLKPTRTRNSKSEKVSKTRYKTSDYSSSEDSEHLSPSHTSDQNKNNEFVEEIRRSVSRASNVSAIDVYRAAGEYWNKFPKTDYTYSPHSKDRTEIAPGVIAMPNMSRRSLHDFAMQDKYTSTDLYQADYSNYSSKLTSEYDTKTIKPANIFASNNNYEDSYWHTSSTSRSSSLKKRTLIQRILSVVTTTILTIVHWIWVPFHYAYNTQNSVLTWFGKLIHKMTTRLMLWDTWLLRSSHKKKKISTVLALCLIPLLLLGGWWLLSGLGSVFYAFYATLLNATSAVLSSVPAIIPIIGKSSESVYKENYVQGNVLIQPVDSFNSRLEDAKEDRIITVKERLVLEPPSADEIAAQLTSGQLEAIANSIRYKLDVDNSRDVDVIIEKILHSPAVQEVFNNYNELNWRIDNMKVEGSGAGVVSNYDEALLRDQQRIIERLQDEIRKVRADLVDLEEARSEEIARLLNQLRSESAQSNAQLAYQLRRCCRSSFIHMESYITKILKDFLGAPSYLSTPKDISSWLHSTFIAKEELELQLANLTRHLKSDYNSLIENNGQMLMDRIMASITKELNTRIEQTLSNIDVKKGTSEVTLNSLTDEHIKKIVTDALAIYDADKTGLVDYALESAGGQVLSTRCTESYQARTAVVSILGIPLWYPTNTPRTVISPGMTPGECWAFQNFPGFLVIKLAGPVNIDAFSMEHISKKLISSGKIDSAPRDFEVYGLRNESDKEPILIGRYTYDNNGEPLQYFAAANHGLVFDTIELRILSNHGNPNYTCLYRFRVHGGPGHKHTLRSGSGSPGDKYCPVRTCTCTCTSTSTSKV